eukprot:10297562-Alexandrium_andersonii.AAC.1
MEQCASSRPRSARSRRGGCRRRSGPAWTWPTACRSRRATNSRSACSPLPACSRCSRRPSTCPRPASWAGGP